MNNFFASVRKDIIVSIVATAIIVYFIEPIFSFIWKLINSQFNKNNDQIYSEASLGVRNWIDFLTLTYLTLVILSFFIIRLKSTPSRLKSLPKERKKVNEEDSRVEIVLLKERLELLNRRRIYYYIGFGIFHIVGLLSIFKVIFLAYTDLQLNTSFNQRLNAISPYIDEQQEEELKSSWAMMENRKDYISINTKLDSLAKVNRKKLPDLLLK